MRDVPFLGKFVGRHRRVVACPLNGSSKLVGKQRVPLGFIQDMVTYKPKITVATVGQHLALLRNLVNIFNVGIKVQISPPIVETM